MRIAAFIRGYNNLVNAANAGVGLSEAADILSPVLDVRTMLEGNRREHATAAGNLGALLLQVFGPPIGEVWRLKAFGLHVQCGVGVTATDVSVGMNFPGAGRQPLSNVQSCAASREIQVYADGMIDQLLYPGEGLYIDAAAVTGVPTYNAYVTYDLVASTSA